MILSSLNKDQKEAVGLLQIGTFLEYFDLMLYVHMAVLLNELFFPKTDPKTASLLAAFVFCSTFVLRPFGALIFGWIGDTIGRKTTVIVTTIMMSISCLVMANLPTYAQIGITATWLVTLCRIVQGLSSMGEVMGAQVYMTEITRPPVQYPAVAFIGFATTMGAVAALGIATLVTSQGFNWRLAFWGGALIAIVGSIARLRLKESPEFTAKKKLFSLKHKEMVFKESLNKKTVAACFFIYCGWPLCFYLAFMYFNPLLKGEFGYSPEEIIYHNFWLSIVLAVGCFISSGLSYKIYPLTILKRKAQLFLLVIPFLPFLIQEANQPGYIFLIQSFIILGSIGTNPADAIFFKYFPVFKRVTAASFLYAASRAIIYVITSFGLVFLSEWLGHWGLLILMSPLTLGFLWGVDHFEKLERIAA